MSTDDEEIKQVVEDLWVEKSHLFALPNYNGYGRIKRSTPSRHHWIFIKMNSMAALRRSVFCRQPVLLRTAQHIIEAHQLWQDDLEMVVSVKETKPNPYFSLFEENKQGYIEKSKKGNFTRRQDCPKAWEFNGAIYFINIQTLRKADNCTI
ncbi:MAG: hypothetical protein U5Q03_13640 [Bacteroidota bacterium]|nr:hypothetical protein [Bacteroidota bacterium]